MIQNLIVFQKTYDFLLWIKPVVQRFAKVHKYGLGMELERESIALLKKIIVANLTRVDKAMRIEEALVAYEVVRMYMRLAHDYKLLNVKQYEYAAGQLTEIGNLLGGWRKKFSLFVPGKEIVGSVSHHDTLPTVSLKASSINKLL